MAFCCADALARPRQGSPPNVKASRREPRGFMSLNLPLRENSSKQRNQTDDPHIGNTEGVDHSVCLALGIAIFQREE